MAPPGSGHSREYEHAETIKRLTVVELAVADDPFARRSEVERAVDDAFLDAVRDGAPTPDGGKASRGKGSRSRMKRASRPGVPKTFGSRSK